MEATASGHVVLVTLAPPAHDSGHNRVARAHGAARLAALLGYAFGGDHDVARPPAGRLYFVPDETLLADRAAGLRVRNADDLFGGVVPHAFVATKAITHGVVSADARVPAGWSHALAALLDGVVIEGCTAFSREDARRAGARLLRGGPVRLKRVTGIGGAGQAIARDVDEFEAALGALANEELADAGVVVERNLEETVTYSIGALQVGGRRISYYGTQCSTRNHHGHEVYGGSDLVVAKGGFDALARVGIPPPIRAALTWALRYDAIVTREFPAFFASRRNYDIVQGRDAHGTLRGGVLEQSWRFGGASAAEIAALHAFAAEPRLRAVRASTHEVYGDPQVPPDALVYYRGIDPGVGALVKYCRVEAHGHPA